MDLSDWLFQGPVGWFFQAIAEFLRHLVGMDPGFIAGFIVFLVIVWLVLRKSPFR